ncbi:hypothetical protein RJ640_002007 [Escallonia rubra]|uniref:Uncharacterized protein n=1 Tax=Escallonia rubra TaxID=112253 RepID=A0AA88UN00_9ASTE|nr:hypothetical protein RJ640_002007 [Escallonia rubra]
MNYESVMEGFFDQLKLVIIVSPLLLLLVVHLLSNFDSRWSPFFMPLPERDFPDRAGGTPWGVGLLLTLERVLGSMVATNFEQLPAACRFGGETKRKPSKEMATALVGYILATRLSPSHLRQHHHRNTATFQQAATTASHGLHHRQKPTDPRNPLSPHPHPATSQKTPTAAIIAETQRRQHQKHPRPPPS